MAISRVLQNLSASERRLAVVTAVLLAAFAVFLVVNRCLDALETLDATIESQELALVQFTEQAALAAPVERAFQAMATQHSSKWTQQEIHDRLAFEIRRLTLRQVPPEGAPLPPARPGDSLVEIRAMPAGALDDSGNGYRSYQINFRTEPTSIQNIATFLQRLQQSTQALRVDFLELTRQPLSTDITAEFHVTRTVIDDAGASDAVTAAVEAAPAGNVTRNGGFEMWDAAQQQPADWNANGVAMSPETIEKTEGATALKATASAAGATVYQVQQLRAGATYEMRFDAASTGTVRIDVIDEATGDPMEGSSSLGTEPGMFAYRFRFTVPGSEAVPIPMRAPNFTFETVGASLIIDNVTIEEVRP